MSVIVSRLAGGAAITTLCPRFIAKMNLLVELLATIDIVPDIDRSRLLPVDERFMEKVVAKPVLRLRVARKVNREPAGCFSAGSKLFFSTRSIWLSPVDLSIFARLLPGFFAIDTGGMTGTNDQFPSDLHLSAVSHLPSAEDSEVEKSPVQRGAAGAESGLAAAIIAYISRGQVMATQTKQDSTFKAAKQLSRAVRERYYDEHIAEDCAAGDDPGRRRPDLHKHRMCSQWEANPPR